MESRGGAALVLMLVLVLLAGAEAFGRRTRPRADAAKDDGLLLLQAADAGGGGDGDNNNTSSADDKKSLAQQVAEGKYGLIQDLLPKKKRRRPGIVSYAANAEVPADTAENLGGLDQEDIWLAEDHVLVLAGGGFRDKAGAVQPQWPPIDDLQAPRRQVKIPARPSVPPPFPVQLRDGERPQFIGGPNGSLPHTEANHSEADEDDPSLYYPPPYDFFYAGGDNSTQVPPGPLVPGIVLPPPLDFFSPLNDSAPSSTPGPRYLPAEPSKAGRNHNNVRIRYPGRTDTPLYFYDGPGISQQVVVSAPEDPHHRSRPSGFQKGPPANNHVIYVFASPDEDFRANLVSTTAPPRDVPTPPRLEDFHSEGRGGRTRYFVHDYRRPNGTEQGWRPHVPRGGAGQQGRTPVTAKPPVLAAREPSPVIPRPDTIRSYVREKPEVHVGSTARPYAYAPSANDVEAGRPLAFHRPAPLAGSFTPLGPSRIRFPPDHSSFHHQRPGFVVVAAAPPPSQRPAVQYQEYFEAKGHPATHLTNIGGFRSYGDRAVFVQGGSGTQQSNAFRYTLGNAAAQLRSSPYSFREVEGRQRSPLYPAAAPYASSSTTPSPLPAYYSSTTPSPLPAYYTTRDVSLFDDATKNYFNVFGQKLSEGGAPTTPLPPSSFSLEDDIRVNFREPLPRINPDSEFVRGRGGAEQGAVVSYQLPGVDGKGSAGSSHYFFLTPQPAAAPPQAEHRHLGGYW